MYHRHALMEYNIGQPVLSVSRELSALSDAHLRDIGLQRDQLHSLAEGASRYQLAAWLRRLLRRREPALTVPEAPARA